jgi:hemerythrin-like domain-containing protein
MASVDIESGLAAFFEQDHRDCDARWVDVEELLDTQDVDAARPAWRKFDAGLRRHIAMEEEVMFPALESAASMGGGGPTAVMRIEHQQMIGLLDQIDAAVESGDAEQALDIGDTLLMLIQQHTIKEEGTLYPMAENLLAGSWPALAKLLEEY